MALVSLMLIAPVSAHEPKEYTILLKEDRITPNGVSPGILVSSDSLFFYNVDGRENVTHRILVDVEGDLVSENWPEKDAEAEAPETEG